MESKLLGWSYPLTARVLADDKEKLRKLPDKKDEQKKRERCSYYTETADHIQLPSKDVEKPNKQKNCRYIR